MTHCNRIRWVVSTRNVSPRHVCFSIKKKKKKNYAIVTRVLKLERDRKRNNISKIYYDITSLLDKTQIRYITDITSLVCLFFYNCISVEFHHLPIWHSFFFSSFIFLVFLLFLFYSFFLLSACLLVSYHLSIHKETTSKKIIHQTRPNMVIFTT